MTAADLLWGPDGARTAMTECAVVVVVDVLSFATCVSVATARGATVRPVAWDEGVRLGPGEVLAGPRGGTGLSLSPVSLQSLGSRQQLVLPSANGGSIAAQLSAGSDGTGLAVVAASLRNASAVARWVRRNGGRVGVVAAGELDGDGTWRPAYEDLVGAGALLSQAEGSGSPQVQAAVRAFEDARGDLGARLRASRSGRELIAAGFAVDVECAAEVDADAVVPVLDDGVFYAAPEASETPRPV